MGYLLVGVSTMANILQWRASSIDGKINMDVNMATRGVLHTRNLTSDKLELEALFSVLFPYCHQ